MWALLREQTPDWSQPTIVDGFEGILYSYGSSNMRRRLYVWA
ncbi:hypothetical protein AAZX31_04G074100 [Glycine max]